MKKVVFKMLFVAVATLSLTSCREYSREQDQKDKESNGKGMLLEAESSKKVKIEQAKADNESAKLDAQTKIIQANAEAQSKIINAKASAEARIINAKSQAEANKMLDASVTATILEYNKIQKWDGKLPSTSVGSGSSTIIGLK